MDFIPSGGSTNIHTSLTFIDFISDFMASTTYQSQISALHSCRRSDPRCSHRVQQNPHFESKNHSMSGGCDTLSNLLNGVSITDSELDLIKSNFVGSPDCVGSSIHQTSSSSILEALIPLLNFFLKKIYFVAQKHFLFISKIKVIPLDFFRISYEDTLVRPRS